MSHFVIPDALCNNNLSQFVIPDTLCYNNLTHFGIKLLFCFVRWNMSKKPTKIISLLAQDLKPQYLAGWWVKMKDHQQQIHVNLWSRNQMITWEMKNVIFSLPRGLRLPNVTGRHLLMKECCSQSHVTRWSSGHIRSHDK